ncbi:MAG: hypothetical protein WBF33_12780 [Candidatus Nitrosopolaris sp.]|jgi:hypothetical protein
MNSKTTMAFSTMTIAAVVLLFASGPIVQNQAFAANLYGSGLVGYHGGYGHHYHYYSYHHRHYRR